MAAYYNELDPYAAQWLRNLIGAGHIASGEVDERSIAHVAGDDLREFDQCHFFAGICVWSYALRLAGWPDDREVWTGSCPCQPFSAAGKGEGYADERHLWPHWHGLIAERRPSVIFGEQVDAAIRTGWLDDVCLSLESLGYAVGAVSFPACSVGAPHIRQRLYFVADSDHAQRWPVDRSQQDECDGHDARWQETHGEFGACSEVRRMADSHKERRDRHEKRNSAPIGDLACETWPSWRDVGGRSIVGGANGERHQGTAIRAATRRRIRLEQPGAVGDFWRDAEWLPCIDGKARPVEPGTFPLAHGATARVGRLRAYGNCIVAPQAAEFIAAFMECRP